MGNTGKKKYTRLVEYDAVTGVATGRVKANIPSDPDYVAPVTDLTACPLPVPTTVANQVVQVNFTATGTFSVTVQKGNFTQSNSVGGSWIIPTYFYESVTFVLSGITGTVQLQVVYGTGQVSYVDVNANWTVLLPGNFFNITEINIL